MNTIKIAFLSAIILISLSSNCGKDSSKEHLQRGISLCNKGLLEEGIKEFEKAAKIKPEYADIYSNWG